MPKVLEGTARELILNINKFCESEKKGKALLIPLRKVRARVAALAGVSEVTVRRIVKEGEIAAKTSSRLITPGKHRPHPKKIIVDQNDLNFIRQKIQHYFDTYKEMPSVSKLRLELMTDINFKGSDSTLRRILKSIDFKFKSTPPKSPFPSDKKVKRKKPTKTKEAQATSTNNIFQEGNVQYQNLTDINSVFLPQSTFAQLQSQIQPPMVNNR